jgi:hypothetical protein
MILNPCSAVACTFLEALTLVDSLIEVLLFPKLNGDKAFLGQRNHQEKSKCRKKIFRKE